MQRACNVLRMAAIIACATILAVLGGIVAVHENAEAGRVLWKQQCPNSAALEYYPEKDGAVNVVCVLGDEDLVSK